MGDADDAVNLHAATCSHVILPDANGGGKDAGCVDADPRQLA